MNKVLKILLIITIFSVFITGCKNKEEVIIDNDSNKTTEDKIDVIDNINEEIKTVKIYINDKEYTINLEENETVSSFVNNIPKELVMNELNGNEKYVYLDETLPTKSYNPNYINKGDVMLYGNNCLVIFYKSFNTTYTYTKIGHIDNLEDLGSGSISVKLEK